MGALWRELPQVARSRPTSLDVVHGRIFASVLAAAATLATLAATASADIVPEERKRTFTEMYGTPPLAEGRAQLRAAASDEPKPTPRADCGPGSNPAPGLSGRISAEAIASGKGKNGFTCNTTPVSREGDAGGFKVERFVDRAGRECAYYDTTLLFPVNPANPTDRPSGTAVIDMLNPAKPVRTEMLVTPAMSTPHESVLVNQKRGLLAAVAGNAGTLPGIVDVYDLNDDCRHPVLQSSLPVARLGHESGFAPDGLTFYATQLYTGTISAIDLTDPKAPRSVWEGDHLSHGMTVSDDGKRGYLAADFGLKIIDLSEVQARKPNPQVREVSRLAWKRGSIPQVALPMTIKGKPYLLEVDEFSSTAGGGRLPADNGENVGAARIIDISDDRAPKLVSNIRLEVHQAENRAAIAGDPGASGSQKGYVQGYAGHYCSLPRRADPGIVACSFILSGLRIFDIRDPESPREIAYYAAPVGEGQQENNWAMSGPAFALARREVWYSDGYSGFHAVRVAEDVWPLRANGAVAQGCVDRRRFTFRLHRDRGSRVVRAVVYVNGKRRLSRRGRSLRSVSLRRLPQGRFTVKIVADQSNGWRRISTRVYRADCTKGAPRTRRVRVR